MHIMADSDLKQEVCNKGVPKHPVSLALLSSYPYHFARVNVHLHEL